MAIQASRLSTALHKTSKPGVLPENSVHGCPNPCWSLFGNGMNFNHTKFYYSEELLCILADEGGHKVLGEPVFS